jgi:hypothetical protein
MSREHEKEIKTADKKARKMRKRLKKLVHATNTMVWTRIAKLDVGMSDTPGWAVKQAGLGST